MLARSTTWHKDTEDALRHILDITDWESPAEPCNIRQDWKTKKSRNQSVRVAAPFDAHLFGILSAMETKLEMVLNEDLWRIAVRDESVAQPGEIACPGQGLSSSGIFELINDAIHKFHAFHGAPLSGALALHNPSSPSALHRSTAWRMLAASIV